MTVFNFRRLLCVGLLCGLTGIADAADVAPVTPTSQLYPVELSRRVGLQDPDQGGLPNDFWQDSKAADILPLIDQLPDHQPLHIAEALQLRLLLSPATPPDGAMPQDWLAHRLQKLVAMQAYHQAAQLYYLAWRGQTMTDNAQLALTALHIAANESDAACLQYLAARDTAQNSDWQFVQGYCAPLVPKLITAPTLPSNDPRTAMVAALGKNIKAWTDFTAAMLPVFSLHTLPKPVTEDAENIVPPEAPITGLEWLQNNTTGQLALMHLHGLLALGEGSNKSLVHQRWQANGLTDEAQSLFSNKLPAPPPEE